VAVASEDTAPGSLAELRRQTDVLVDRGYPALAGITEAALRRLVEWLSPRAPQEPFVLVVTRALVPLDRLIGHTRLGPRRGFTSMDAQDILAFRPTADVDVPESPVYLVVDVDTGAETLNVRPDDALPGILASGRTPLTLEEGLAVVTQHPEWLRERNCFEMLGSRAGDKRVAGIWVSKGAPRLGWCWGGNPHTWLGMATASRRVG
jgi:hypothetical protein